MDSDFSAPQYFYLNNEEAQGPITEMQLKAWIRDGKINQHFRVCQAGTENWVEVGTLPLWDEENPATTANEKRCKTETQCRNIAAFMFIFSGIMLLCSLDSGGTKSAIWMSNAIICLFAAVMLKAAAKALSHLRQIANKD